MDGTSNDNRRKNNPKYVKKECQRYNEERKQKTK